MNNPVYDCFLYNGEAKMLNFRLHELNDLVDFFIIGESSYTFKGDPKPLTLSSIKEILKPFASKIIYVTNDIAPTANAWENEKNQRDSLIEGFRGKEIKSSDIIILSDVDEIPDLDFLANAKKSGISGAHTCYQNFYYYSTSFRKMNKWPGTVILNARTFKEQFNGSFEYVRQSRHQLPLIGSKGDFSSGGWHFSYFGDVDYIIKKIQSFSHQEYNNARYTDPEKIKQLMKEGKDLFFRSGEDLVEVNDEVYRPKFIH